jgi:hypothetical protein
MLAFDRRWRIENHRQLVASVLALANSLVLVRGGRVGRSKGRARLGACPPPTAWSEPASLGCSWVRSRRRNWVAVASGKAVSLLNEIWSTEVAALPPCRARRPPRVFHPEPHVPWAAWREQR